MIIQKIRRHLLKRTLFKAIMSKVRLRIKHIRQRTIIPSRLKNIQIMKNHEFRNKINHYMEMDKEKSHSETQGLLLANFGANNYSGDRGFSKKFLSNLTELILSRRLGTIVNESEYCYFLQEISNTNHLKLSIVEWRNLCYISGCNGLYEAANKFRNLAIQRALSIEKNTIKNEKKELFEAFTAAIDIGDFARADFILNRISSIPIKSLPTDDMKLFYHLVKGDRKKALSISKLKYNDNDILFSEYIEGKTIAIVGPAPSDEDVAQEIDSFDIVVRLNYKGRDKLPPKEEFGSKLNVSYYNGGNASYINCSENYEFLKDLNFAVFKSLNYKFQEDIIIHSKKGRLARSQDLYIFDGALSMIPIVLLDILTFNPKEVKVFKTNFFLAKNTHFKGYQSKQYLNRPHEIKWYSHWEHNLVTQINIVKNLWNSGQIKVDKNCKKVLELSPEHYVKEMEKIYVKDELANIES